jgi:hypothetical protein
MRNKLFYLSGLTILTAIYAATPASAPTSSAPVTFPVYGFSINPFEMPTDGPVLQALQMSWPIMPMPSNKNQGAAPAVNVIVWPGNDDMVQYETKERLDLQMRGLSIQHETTNKDNTEWSLEYVGVVNGAGMHWYAHVVSSPKRIFIATGMAPDEMWGQYGDKIKSCVDSLKSTGTAQIAPTSVPTLSSAPAMAAPASTATAVPPVKMAP